jgi:hypothetical protein
MYSALEKTTNEVRVLRLVAGDEDDPISGGLEISPIDLTAEYEALSYAWGSSEKPKAILLNGQSFPVTENLHTALRHLRRADAPRLLWIDALCIDQSNNAERLHQVQMMADIYRRAARVLVWLGPSMDDSDIVMDLIMDSARAVDSRPIKPTPLNDLELARPLNELATRTIQVQRLLHRPYWFRVWVVQEIAVPNYDPLVGCGSKWIPWPKMKIGLVALLARVKYQLVPFGTDTVRVLREEESNRACLESMNRFFGLAQIRESVQHLTRKRNGLETPDMFPQLTNILDLLWLTRYKQCADPRDNVYSLLGLFCWVNGGKIPRELTPAPDYTSSLRSVCIAATKMAIRIGGTLDILHMKNHVQFDFLPSWVPNFSASATQCFPSLAKTPLEQRVRHRASWDYDIWSLSKYHEVRNSGQEEPDELRVRGQSFDTISSVVDLTGFDRDAFNCIRRVHDTATLRDAAASMPDVSQEQPNRRNATTDVSKYVTDAIWRTLAADSTAEDAPCPSNHGVAYARIIQHAQGLLGSSTDSPLEDANVKPLLDDIRRAVRHSESGLHRRFFVSTTGHFGLGPPDCEPGDVLCVFQNFSLAGVLRRRGAFHAYVGSAYIHGAMNGEEYPHHHGGLEEFVLR